CARDLQHWCHKYCDDRRAGGGCSDRDGPFPGAVDKLQDAAAGGRRAGRTGAPRPGASATIPSSIPTAWDGPADGRRSPAGPSRDGAGRRPRRGSGRPAGGERAGALFHPVPPRWPGPLADRGDVGGAMSGRRRRRLGWTALAAIAVLVAPARGRGQQDFLCPYFAGCEFEAPGFTIRIVDEQTGQPVTDAHAMAIWIVYGMYGRKAPIMTLEAVSGADGTVTFPAWGPLRGGSTGLEPGHDPGISRFKAGYRTLFVINPTPVGQLLVRVHPFRSSGDTFALTPFRGTPAETVVELRNAADPLVASGPSQNNSASIRRAYVNRWRNVRAEADRLPQDMPEVKQLLWLLDSSIQLFDTGGR